VRREERLRATEDFRRTRAAGRSYPHPLLVLVAARSPAPEDGTRVGISAGKRVGGAVVRNRARRRVREAVRTRYACLAPGWDLIFVVRAAAAQAPRGAIEAAVVSVLHKAGLLKMEATCAGSRSP